MSIMENLSSKELSNEDTAATQEARNIVEALIADGEVINVIKAISSNESMTEVKDEGRLSVLDNERIWQTSSDPDIAITVRVGRIKDNIDYDFSELSIGPYSYQSQRIEDTWVVEGFYKSNPDTGERVKVDLGTEQGQYALTDMKENLSHQIMLQNISIQ